MTRLIIAVMHTTFSCCEITNVFHFEIAQFNSLNTRTTAFWSVPLYIEPVAGFSKSDARNAFTSHLEKMSTSCQRNVKNSAIFVNKSHL